MVGAVLPAVAPAGRLYSGPEFYPLWEEAQKLDVPVSTHGGLSMPSLGLDMVNNFTIGHTLEHPFAQIRQFTALMFEGVFELFPNFKFGCIECGVGWVPYMMDRMDEEQERKGHYSPRCKLKPSEYVKKGNIFFAVEVEESGPAARRAGGERERADLGIRLSARARSARLQPRHSEPDQSQRCRAMSSSAKSSGTTRCVFIRA